MSKTVEQRPPQATTAAMVVVVGAVMSLMTAWELMSGLRSIETRETAAEQLEVPPFAGSGMDVEGVLQVLHSASLVAAVAAIPIGILGWQAVRGDKVARVVLTVLAVPMVFAGFVTGLFRLPIGQALIALGAVLLWVSPTREWITTGKWTPPPEPAREERPPVVVPPHDNAQGSASPRPEAHPPAGGPGPSPSPYASGPRPNAIPAPAWPQPGAGAAAERRPSVVVLAFVITVVCTLVVALVASMAMLMVTVAPDALMQEMERQQADLDDMEITVSQMRWSIWLSCGICVAMCVAAVVFSSFAMARREWARRAWLVISGAVAGGCIFMVLVQPALGGLMAMLPAAAAIITVSCLRRPDVRRWFGTAPGRK